MTEDDADGAAIGREIELKLAIPPEQAKRFASNRVLARLGASALAPATRRLVSTYFDTADFRLAKQRIALRVRQDGTKRTQTIKRASTPRDGFNARSEHEVEIEGDRPEVDRVEPNGLRRLLWKDGIRKRLKPVFITDLRRRTWPLEIDGARVELALDIGTISSGRKSVPICEAELELKSGDADSLYKIARALHRTIPFTLEARTKAERGYALAAKILPRPRRAQPVRLDKDATLAAAWIAVGRNGFHQLRANEAVLRATGCAEVEGVHQFRVAVRRLRSVLTAFRSVLPDSERERVSAELKWIAQECGPARDADVFKADLMAPLRRRLPDDASLLQLDRAVDNARAAATARVAALLDSRRYTEAVLGVESWWATAPAKLFAGNAEEPAIDVARAALKRFHHKLAKSGARIGRLEEAQLHALRIRAKKLRYASEFFRALFPGRDPRRYLAALASIQDRLGSLNDGAVARSLLSRLDQMEGMDPTALARAGGTVSGWLLARIEADLKRLPEAWERFDAVKPFWK